jgi:hypothetical protein
MHETRQGLVLYHTDGHHKCGNLVMSGLGSFRIDSKGNVRRIAPMVSVLSVSMINANVWNAHVSLAEH